MPWWNPGDWDWQRVGEGVATGGLSELWDPNNYIDTADAAIDGDQEAWLNERGDGVLTNGDIHQAQLPGFQQQYAETQGAINATRGDRRMQASQVGASQQQHNANALVSQLQMQADGRGPSLAGQQYKNAHQEGVAGMKALAAGGRGAQGARYAAGNIGRQNAGLASGLAEATTREQMAARSQLGQAIGQADNMDYQRQAMNAQLTQQASQANQQAYYSALAHQLGLSQQQLNALIAQNNARLGLAGLPSNLDRVIQTGATVASVAV
jgi:hypothetical protein